VNHIRRQSTRSLS